MTDRDAFYFMLLCALTIAAAAFTVIVRYIARRAARNVVLSYLKAGMLPPRDKQGKFKRRA